MTEWRDVPGWEGFYQVSNDGRVQSVDRSVRFRQRSKRVTRICGGTERCLKMSRGGYLVVGLYRPGKRAFPPVNVVEGR